MTATVGANPWPASWSTEARPRVGFFTDTSICIGCKACEVACKEWNDVPNKAWELSGRSYDNTLGLDADAWRHVAFVEQRIPADAVAAGPEVTTLQAVTQASEGLRWLMSSDVCKHCTEAACLDVCPTGSIFRTEFGTVVVQEDICNGCGYCVPACPYGVLSKRKGDERVFKCTLCYDRLKGGLEPACAKACPTNSIQFGPLHELRHHAGERLEHLRSLGLPGVQLYGHDPEDGVGGTGAFFLLLDDPEVYGLPPDPVVSTRHLKGMWATAGAAAATVLGLVAGAFLGGRR